MAEMETGKKRIVAITGPTATSAQVYRRMDVGTDKLMAEDREGVVHHLIDVVDPDRTFSAAEFARRSDGLIEEGAGRGEVAVVAGGTGFYLRALMWGLFPGPPAQSEVRERLRAEAAEVGLTSLHDRLREVDPEAARRIHPNDPARIIRALEVFEATGEAMSAHFERQDKDGPRYDALILGLAMDRELMYKRINRRVDLMLERGLVDETVKLREMGYGPELPSQRALGYKQIHQHLDGEIDLDRASYLIKRDTRHFARRQITWLKKEPGLEWVATDGLGGAIERAADFLEEKK